jgi:hypothetical protein
MEDVSEGSWNLPTLCLRERGLNHIDDKHKQNNT